MRQLFALLEQAEVLCKFTNSQKERLTAFAVRRALGKDETLFWQGDDWRNVLLIASGKLRSVIHAPDGRSYVVSTWGEQEEFWAHTLFDSEPMPSTL
jgi:CRP/FNR family transcriptional regulator, cyclic AMP receptor protein